ncbi:MAG: TVP38/TMEM64 family protein [Planctomycetota bacterium]|nr:MAG: TVP38/TMEM64 family protein [Planctomycetota bacterium]
MKKSLSLLAFAAAVVAAWWFLPLERVDEMTAWLRAQGLAGAVLLGLAYAMATVLMLPGSLVTLLVGYAYGPWFGFLLVSPASVLGATLAFLLARSFLRSSVEAKIAAKPRFQALDQAVAEQGFKLLVLTRLSPVFPFVVLNYAFGLTRISLLAYVFGSFLGMIPGTLLYVYLGSTVEDVTQLGQGAPEGSTAGQILKWVGLAATLGVTLWLTRMARQALKQAAPELAQPATGSLSEKAEKAEKAEYGR